MFDGFGNAMLQALSSGVPPIATTGGGPTFLVQSGLTFVAVSDTTFTRCIVDQRNHPEMHANMRKTARERV